MYTCVARDTHLFYLLVLGILPHCYVVSLRFAYLMQDGMQQYLDNLDGST